MSTENMRDIGKYIIKLIYTDSLQKVLCKRLLRNKKTQLYFITYNTTYKFRKKQKKHN